MYKMTKSRGSKSFSLFLVYILVFNIATWGMPRSTNAKAPSPKSASKNLDPSLVGVHDSDGEHDTSHRSSSCDSISADSWVTFNPGEHINITTPLCVSNPNDPCYFSGCSVNEEETYTRWELDQGEYFFDQAFDVPTDEADFLCIVGGGSSSSQTPLATNQQNRLFTIDAACEGSACSKEIRIARLEFACGYAPQGGAIYINGTEFDAALTLFDLDLNDNTANQ
ncbi:MAG: hypothetical protein QGI45_01985, partial [Myxococcota bacterium]|nr:hypothetical protein [Myxococcota bacterium]